MNDQQVEEIRARYLDVLRALFFPDDAVDKDIVNYFAALLRIFGMEDYGWDPYLESKSILEDLNRFLQMDLPTEAFPNRNLTKWRVGLLLYSHIVEMDAPYEVITNLLRLNLGKGYSPNPYYIFLNHKQKKKKTLYPKEKIKIIKELSNLAKHTVGDVFDEFYNGELRNAIDHSDFIITESEFRARNGTEKSGPFKISLEEVNNLITKSKIFISSFFGLEAAARRHWGTLKLKAIPYDFSYKGLMEILVDEDDLMCGFKLHWPNNTESVYKRTDKGIDMVNCMPDITNATLQFDVGPYAKNRGRFSPLVEADALPIYTKLQGTDEVPVWPVEAVLEK
jgi:hypothetical protein